MLSHHLSKMLTVKELAILALVSRRCKQISYQASLIAVESVDDLLKADKKPVKWIWSDLRRLRACLSLPYPHICSGQCTITTNQDGVLILKQGNDLVAVLCNDDLLYKTMKWREPVHLDMIVRLDTQPPIRTISTQRCAVCGLGRCAGKTEIKCSLKLASWFHELCPHRVWSPTSRCYLLSDNLSVQAA